MGIELHRLEFAFGASNQSVSVQNPGYVGITHNFVIETPNFTNDVTATFSIINKYGVTIYSSPAISRGQSPALYAERVLVGSETFRVALSGVPGGSGGIVRITPYLI